MRFAKKKCERIKAIGVRQAAAMVSSFAQTQMRKMILYAGFMDRLIRSQITKGGLYEA